MDASQRVLLLRHGETEWSAIGRHTGRSDIGLTDKGRDEARAAAAPLRAWQFAVVLCSPLRRARETCDLAGLGQNVEVDPDLQEWDYGTYEGRTSAEIQAERPGWLIWGDGVPSGETVDEVGARADRAVARVRDVDGDVCIVAHGHFLRILASRWLELAAVEGRRFELGTAAISILGYERGIAAVARWNDRSHLGITT